MLVAKYANYFNKFKYFLVDDVKFDKYLKYNGPLCRNDSLDMTKDDSHSRVLTTMSSISRISLNETYSMLIIVTG